MVRDPQNHVAMATYSDDEPDQSLKVELPGKTASNHRSCIDRQTDKRHKEARQGRHGGGDETAKEDLRCVGSPPDTTQSVFVVSPHP